ncbi:MAG: hypothetical protein H6872_08440 [Methylobacteriaceae bacterium]|nr:hypothetical protein [Methylobacteriaceae bacterium]
MVIQDIMNSCSNEQVAEAAVASIGGTFARRVRETATRRGVRPGALAASAVLRFRSNARAPEFEALQQAVAGDDLPLLRGLAFIVEPTLGEGVDRA